jgi:hypothetical protein
MAFAYNCWTFLCLLLRKSVKFLRRVSNTIKVNSQHFNLKVKVELIVTIGDCNSGNCICSFRNVET